MAAAAEAPEIKEVGFGVEKGSVAPWRQSYHIFMRKNDMGPVMSGERGLLRKSVQGAPSEGQAFHSQRWEEDWGGEDWYAKWGEVSEDLRNKVCILRRTKKKSPVMEMDVGVPPYADHARIPKAPFWPIFGLGMWDL